MYVCIYIYIYQDETAGRGPGGPGEPLPPAAANNYMGNGLYYSTLYYLKVC